jgi:2-polyprenyl-6-methoxyphenol hydroxylase-like FAD-dependent oxidoreductase
LEEYLRAAVEKEEFSQLRPSCTLTSISEDAEWVYSTYNDEFDRKKVIRSRFLAAADGKTGFTRKKYLEPKGIKLEWAEQQVQFDMTEKLSDVDQDRNTKRPG